MVKDAISQGAKVVRGAKRSNWGENFYEPTLIQDVNMKMQCAKEEIFGPVAGVLK